MITLQFREEHGDNRIRRLPNGLENAIVFVDGSHMHR